MFRPILTVAVGWLLATTGPAAAQQLGEKKLDEIKRATVLVRWLSAASRNCRSELSVRLGGTASCHQRVCP